MKTKVILSIRPSLAKGPLNFPFLLKHVLLLLLAFSFESDLYGQNFVNATGIKQYGNLGNVEYVKMVLDPNTNDRIIISSKVVGSKSQIHLSCVSITGSLLWEQTFTGSTSYDNYGADVKTDGTYIYFCGKWQSTTHSDIVVAKFDPSNSSLVWSQTYNGVSSGNDAPAAMVLDVSGNIYITGSSCNAGTAPDFCTLKYNNSGSLQWVSNYDYAGLPDAATAIHLDASTGDIYISGTSLTSLTTFTNADIATIQYDNNGNQLNLYRHGFAGHGIDFVTEMAVDGSGNLNLACNHADGGNNFFAVVQLSPTLSVNWVDSSLTQRSEASSIITDNTDAVIVVGHMDNSYGGSNILVKKYSQTGSPAWKKEFHNVNPSDFMKGRRIKVNSNDDYFITGDGVVQNGKDFFTIVLDQNGETLWARYNSTAGINDDVSYDLAVSNNEVYVVGVTSGSGSKELRTLKYSTAFKQQMTASYPSSGANHFPHEFVIRFNPTLVNTTTTDNREITFGTLRDFLTPTGLSQFITLVGAEAGNWRTFKVHPILTSADSLSISRCGDTVKILPYYATFLVEFPSSTSDSATEVLLRNAWNLIETADMNYIIQLCVANDPEYTNGNSPSLDAMGSYTSSSINVSPAWSISTGSPNILVGVFDTGINYQHADFNGSGLTSSKIITGRDYFNGTPYLLNLPVDKLGHGTGNAGIIGAIRNNSLAVAGIAGGDASNGNTGVSLHDMKCFEGNTLGNNSIAFFSAGLDILSQAIVHGAVSFTTNPFGLAQHVQNHSWEMLNISGTPLQIQTLKQNLQTAAENEVVLSFASGNQASSSFTSGSFNGAANFKDEYALCVGGLDQSGNRWATATVGSNGGRFLDFMAAGTHDLYTLLEKNSNGVTDTLRWGLTGTMKRVATGTSFSAPHAAGVAALMISHINNHPQKPNNVSPEDIEKILEMYASAIPSYSTPYDPQVGFGRLNAGLSIQKTELPWYQLKHFNLSVPMASTNITFIDTAFVDLPVTWNTMGPGYGMVEKYEVTYTATHNIGSYVLLGAWKRDARSNLMGNISSQSPSTQDEVIPSMPSIELTSYSSSTASFKGYVYRVINTYTNSPAFVWYPFDPYALHAQAKFAYTLYLKDPTTSIKEEDFSTSLSVFPNPSNGFLTIQYFTDNRENTSISVCDILGRKVHEQRNVQFSPDATIKSVDLSYLPNGIYLVTLRKEDGKSCTFKEIIAH